MNEQFVFVFQLTHRMLQSLQNRPTKAARVSSVQNSAMIGRTVSPPLRKRRAEMFG
ncbi:hypothetical protein HMSSN036_60880 [Paenibacillus macerans]|nr:hypothetical protein HMSSN036_60880 [Paenibacillus macerans]